MCTYILYRWKCRQCTKTQREVRADWDRCAERPRCVYRERGPEVVTLVLCAKCQHEYSRASRSINAVTNAPLPLALALPDTLPLSPGRSSSPPPPLGEHEEVRDAGDDDAVRDRRRR